MREDSERYARVQAVFDRARALRGDARDAFLSDSCRDDDELKAEVESLLAALEADTPALSEDGIAAVREALEGAIPEPQADSEGASSERAAEGAGLAGLGAVPGEIGGYRIQRRIGQGGMGVVYEALQDSPRRRVAIKLLHAHQSGAERLRRFRQEAELLGRLQHPCIAQIYEAGTFDLGSGEQPFFAMEFVDGVNVRLFADRVGLDTRDRLELLARIADGVHHAHERGVIHRDLKPDNILVDPQGRPVILDFGVARNREPSDVLSTMKTEEGVLLGTLAYMAPEQFAGRADAITPRVDVYALGVLAYELLTGRLPHELAGLSLPAAVKVLSESPGRRLGAVAPDLRGDVETVVSTALAREPERRYASAEAFAADLRRYLDDLPIAARPTSRIYRARKYARRHPSIVGSLFVLALAAAVSSAFAVRAVREQAAAERANGHLRDVVEELAQPFPVATRFVQEVDGDFVTVVQGDRLARGTRVMLEVRSLVELNLHVFNQDDTGAVLEIFPTEGLEPRNPLAPDQPYLLPGRMGATQVSWKVESEGETERFLLLALPTDMPFDRADWGLDDIGAVALASRTGSGDLRGLQTDPDSGAAPARSFGVRSLVLFDHLRSEVEKRGTGWVRAVEFESAPADSATGG